MSKIEEIIYSNEFAKQASEKGSSREEVFNYLKKTYPRLNPVDIDQILDKYSFKQPIITERDSYLEKKVVCNEDTGEELILQILGDINKFKKLDEKEVLIFLKGKYPGKDEQIFYRAIDLFKNSPLQNKEPYDKAIKKSKDTFGKRFAFGIVKGIISGSIATVILPVLYREAFRTRMGEDLKWGSFFVFGGLAFLINLLPDPDKKE